MEWTTPIFDRTVEDTTAARRNQAGESNNKGALNYQDLNRIENNYRYLMEHLETDSIYIQHLYRDYEETIIDASGNEVKKRYTDWQEQNIPWLSEINRIRANYNALVRLFLVNLGFPIFKESSYLSWQEVNDWERIADVGKTMFENMEKEYIYCGTIDSGGDRLL